MKQLALFATCVLTFTACGTTGVDSKRLPANLTTAIEAGPAKVLAVHPTDQDGQGEKRAEFTGNGFCMLREISGELGRAGVRISVTQDQTDPKKWTLSAKAGDDGNFRASANCYEFR